MSGRTADAKTCAGWVAGPRVWPIGARKAQYALVSDRQGADSWSRPAWRRYSVDSIGPDRAVVTSADQQRENRDGCRGGTFAQFGQSLLMLLVPCCGASACRFDDACGAAFEERALPTNGDTCLLLLRACEQCKLPCTKRVGKRAR